MDESFSIQTAGVNFHAQQRGRPSDCPAVFLHGFGGDLQTWDTVWAEFGYDFPALRYDLRGFGHTSIEASQPFSHADDLLSVLEAMAIPRCDLVGVSMGGSIALNFALDHPDRVRNLVLISPGLVAWEWSDAWRALWTPIREQARRGAMAEARQLWWQHPLFATTRETPAGPALYDSIMRFSGEPWVRNDERMMLPDVERLHLLGTRTLLLTGGQDFEDFRLIADLIEASTEAVERIDTPAMGHLLHLEAPVLCARRILSFCGITRSFSSQLDN